MGAGEEGGNKVVREWIGGGLKALGEMMEAEEEGEEGEREGVVKEVLVSFSSWFFSRLETFLTPIFALFVFVPPPKNREP